MLLKCISHNSFLRHFTFYQQLVLYKINTSVHVQSKSMLFFLFLQFYSCFAWFDLIFVMFVFTSKIFSVFKANISVARILRINRMKWLILFLYLLKVIKLAICWTKSIVLLRNSMNNYENETLHLFRAQASITLKVSSSTVAIEYGSIVCVSNVLKISFRFVFSSFFTRSKCRHTLSWELG